MEEIIEQLKRIGQDRQEFIKKLSDELIDRAGKIETWLYNALYNEIVEKSDIKTGRFQSINDAIRLIAKSSVWALYRERMIGLVDWMVKQIAGIGAMLSRYFTLFLPDEREVVGDYARNSVNKYLQVLGWSGKSYEKGYFFYNLINDISVERQVKARAMLAIRAGKTVAQFRETILESVKGGAPVRRVYEQYAVTAFAEADRAGSLDVADKFGLNHAIWSGPKLATSRPFCLARKGKVFSRKQLIAMDSLNWQGKIKNQSTLVSAGGARCVDILLWISEEMALQLGWSE